jgi:pimeloyl-ACP methyl ester carboxylesterase
MEGDRLMKKNSTMAIPRKQIFTEEADEPLNLMASNKEPALTQFEKVRHLVSSILSSATLHNSLFTLAGVGAFGLALLAVPSFAQNVPVAAAKSAVSAAAQKTSQIKVPVAITVFPHEIYRAPESWSRQAYPSLYYFHEVDKGGHFAAWEQPELFSQELRAAFRSVR